MHNIKLLVKCFFDFTIQLFKNYFGEKQCLVGFSRNRGTDGSDAVFWNRSRTGTELSQIMQNRSESEPKFRTADTRNAVFGEFHVKKSIQNSLFWVDFNYVFQKCKILMYFIHQKIDQVRNQESGYSTEVFVSWQHSKNCPILKYFGIFPQKIRTVRTVEPNPLKPVQKFRF